jgi:hypothetical protein
MVGGILPWALSPAAFPQQDELAAHFPDGHEHDCGCSDFAGLHRMAAAELRHATTGLRLLRRARMAGARTS